MKECVAAAGLRVPYFFRARTVAEAEAAAERVGYPLVVKPIAGAGSADTYRVEDAAELARVLEATRRVAEVSVEEYIDGEEYTFDTVCVGGRPRYVNVAQYLPKPIVARSVESVSPIIITVRDLEQPKLAAGLKLGHDVLAALGMETGFTHMEWFLKPDGEAVFGEIGCRPGGAHIVDQMNYTNDVDLFREWARAACWDHVEPIGPRKYNASIIFKRALGRGRITRITGLEAFLAKHGAHVVEERLLRPGTPRRDWTQTLISDGHILLRHPDWDTTYELSELVANEITLYAE
jgi:biotin carboxylase